jgi:hypothetical protein
MSGCVDGGQRTDDGGQFQFTIYNLRIYNCIVEIATIKKPPKSLTSGAK